MQGKICFRLMALVVLLSAWACVQSSLTFQVRFAEVRGLRQGDPVLFEGNTIGEVKKVNYTSDGDYLATVTIAPEFRAAATEDSEFLIDARPGDQERKAVVVVQERPGGKVIAPNAVVQGTTPPSYLGTLLEELGKRAGVAEGELRQAVEQLQRSLQSMSRQLDSELQSVLDELSRQLQKMEDGDDRAPENSELRRLEESMSRFVEQFNDAGQEVRRRLQQEILPQLRREIEELRRELRREGREGEMRGIDRQLEKISVV